MKPTLDVTLDVVCDDLMLLFTTVKSHMMRLAEDEGLTAVQLGALHSLYNNGELAMGQVADVLHCDASNVTGIIDRLVAQGLVTRQESVRDRRAKALHLTAKGSDVIERIRQALPSVLGWDKISREDYAVLHAIIHTAAPQDCKIAS